MAHLINLVHAYLPLAVVAGLLSAVLATGSRRRAVGLGGWALACGLLAGAGAFALTLRLESGALVVTALRVLGLGSALVVMALVGPVMRDGARWLAPFRGAALGLLVVLAVQGTHSFLLRTVDQAMSATAVLNTELVVNIGAIAMGVALLAALGALVALMGADLPRIAAALLVSALALLMLPWSADLMLGLLRLEWIAATSGRISYVAKVTATAGWSSTYLQLSVPAILLLGYLAFRPRPATAGLAPPQRAASRKFRLQRRRQLRWLVAGAGLQLGIGGLLLLQDLYLSRPRTLSAATRVMADGDGKVRIAVQSVQDGTLHRFAYLTAERRLVRFFLINRYRDGRVNIGVVFDACDFCGDSGYLQEGNNVVCVGCNVRIFVPSIGKEGGCNPIPLEHEAGPQYVTVRADSLERGARYFNEVLAG